MNNNPKTCPFCKNEIDPDVCHCGEERKNHDAYYCGHSFVSMGCSCGYEKPKKKVVNNLYGMVEALSEI